MYFQNDTFKKEFPRVKQRNIDITKEDLMKFESEVSTEFENAKIRGPVHLSCGNEDYLIKIFEYIHPSDWVFSTWRNHYHALLHGVPREQLMERILIGKSISFQSPEHNFFTSAIVNGILPIATGVAHGLKFKNQTQMVWCFVGDMAAESGIMFESVKFAIRNSLPIHFIVEDNKLSTNTPTQESWGADNQWFNHKWMYEENEQLFRSYVSIFEYTRNKYPHVGVGKWIHF